ncbi:maleylacetate reductase [Acidisoma cellulosilytica]|uniref:Maleylacetate reductase n=1 Tax=Acidisoma cellulosilyticum TaxID=2802395 RepID=A0A964E5S6_9PROT|nr:maleylacetate reductase [Acidisoma cellulosilyticum]MCB8882990.1 maleylacetate reductase [Acidisoma cellulosilyticum]
MTPFTYVALPSRVIFGFGTIARVAEELSALGAARALVLTTPYQTGNGEALVHRLGALAVGLFSNATMHTPVDVTEAAIRALKEVDADCVVALGGGSTTGLSKAIALRTDLPQIIIPTTYAGSEATPIIGETSGGQKHTQKTLKVLPEVIVYDVDLTLGLPAGLTATSGMNAIAHSVEALYAKDGNPIIAGMAEQSIAALARALPKIVTSPGDRDGRSDALYGAWLAGACLGSVGMSLHHKLCHTLGGTFNLPHAETHAVVLPHAVAYNADAAPTAMECIGRAVGASDAADGLYALGRSIGVPQSLRDLGMPEEGIAHAADLAVTDAYWNPRPLELEAIRDLLRNAWEGKPPQASR